MKRTTLAYLFLLPAFALLFVFSVWPFIWALRLSFFSSNGITEPEYVGLDNFREMFGDPVFIQSFVILAIFLILQVPLQTIGPLIGAKLITSLRTSRAQFLYRILFVLPLVIPMMVIFLIWQQLYDLEDGAINRLPELFGAEPWRVQWLGDTRTVLAAIVFTGVPWIGGINLLIYLAGFLNIPNSVYEAARIEGASSLRIFHSIEIPMLLPQIRLIMILATIATIQTYEQIFVLTNGGPANATLVPALYLFKNGFEFQRVGYASAVGFVLFVLTLVLTVVNVRFMRSREEGTQ